MKRVLIFLSIFTLTAFGCKKPETTTSGSAVMKPASSAKAKPSGTTEKMVVGKWNNPAIKGFVAEFKNDHTGTTISANPKNPKQTAELPFKWALEKDGRVKITEGKTSYFGSFVGNKLEVDVKGTKSILEKAP